MDPDISAGEAFPPQEIARKIERIGVAKANAARNILAVTGGNVIGGTLLVAGVYWAAYLRAKSNHGQREQSTADSETADDTGGAR